MIDKKKVIEYMESIYRYFPHIEFIGIDLNGEMIFTIKAKVPYPYDLSFYEMEYKK